MKLVANDSYHDLKHMVQVLNVCYVSAESTPLRDKDCCGLFVFNLSAEQTAADHVYTLFPIKRFMAVTSAKLEATGGCLSPN